MLLLVLLLLASACLYISLSLSLVLKRNGKVKVPPQRVTYGFDIKMGTYNVFLLRLFLNQSEGRLLTVTLSVGLRMCLVCSYYK